MLKHEQDRLPIRLRARIQSVLGYSEVQRRQRLGRHFEQRTRD